MSKIDGIDITSLLWQEGAAAATPAATKWRLYFKTTGLFLKDDAGVETGPLAASVAGNTFEAVALTDASTEAITTSTFTSVAMDTETEDTEGFHTGSSTQIIIPAALNTRRMVFGANVGLAANATGARQATLNLNLAGANTILDYVTGIGSSAISFRVSLISPAIVVATGDTIEVQVWHSVGSNLNTVNANGLPRLYGYTVD